MDRNNPRPLKSQVASQIQIRIQANLKRRKTFGDVETIDRLVIASFQLCEIIVTHFFSHLKHNTDGDHEDNEALMMINCCSSHEQMNIFIRQKLWQSTNKAQRLGITFPLRGERRYYLLNRYFILFTVCFILSILYFILFISYFKPLPYESGNRRWSLNR